MTCAAHNQETGWKAAKHRASEKCFLGISVEPDCQRPTQLQYPVDTSRPARVQRQSEKSCYQLTRDDAAVVPCTCSTARHACRLHYTRFDVLRVYGDLPCKRHLRVTTASCFVALVAKPYLSFWQPNLTIYVACWCFKLCFRDVLVQLEMGCSFILVPKLAQFQGCRLK